jgi:single-stranded-DNA-specific exonuclease
MVEPRGRPFLGVESSFSGRSWRDRLDGPGSVRALAIAQRHGLTDLLSRVLAGRGLGPDDVEAYLEPTLRRHMPDPDTLTDMAPAARRLADAAQAGEQVAVFGDYDVDGATSAALLADWLTAAGARPRIHIPDRIFEGYGPNVEAIRLLRQEGASLLVTVDCGTTSFEALAAAATLGFDVIVIDHHQAAEQLPRALAIVNPNRHDDLSGQGHLAACGVTFLTLVAANRELRHRGWWTTRPEPDLTAGLDLVALGTIADVVALRGLNRAYVLRGLAVMQRRERVGLRALMDSARLDGPPRPYHLGFLLGPRINAGGRIGDASLGARLLRTTDESEATRIAETLDRLNRERQALEAGMLEQAMEEAEAALGQDAAAASVVTASSQWHPGVVGLVAARLKERFGLPAFAIAFDGDVGTGSGRSIEGVDLGSAVRGAVDSGLLVKGGGHAMAAGLTINRQSLGRFRRYLEEHLAASVGLARKNRSLAVDGALAPSGATPDLIASVEQAGPFGQGNPEPVFALPSVTIAFADVVGSAHVKVRLKSADGSTLDAIAFRAAGQPLGEALVARRGGQAHVAGTLSIDRWGGREKVQLRVLDAAPAP